jgi:hypothetical protein
MKLLEVAMWGLLALTFLCPAAFWPWVGSVAFLGLAYLCGVADFLLRSEALEKFAYKNRLNCLTSLGQRRIVG